MFNCHFVQCNGVIYCAVRTPVLADRHTALDVQVAVLMLLISVMNTIRILYRLHLLCGHQSAASYSASLCWADVIHVQRSKRSLRNKRTFLLTVISD